MPAQAERAALPNLRIRARYRGHLGLSYGNACDGRKGGINDMA
jgi:hypothetical protein